MSTTMQQIPANINLPRYTQPGERQSSQWNNQVVDNLRALRQPVEIGPTRRGGFDLYQYMPFRVYLIDETTVGVTEGRVFVHANPSSPFVCSASVSTALDITVDWHYIYIEFKWNTSVPSIKADWTATTAYFSSEYSCNIPLVKVQRYGDGSTDTPYIFAIAEIMHIGDIHICGNTGTIIAGNGEGFRSERTGNPGTNFGPAAPGSITVVGGRVTAAS